VGGSEAGPDASIDCADHGPLPIDACTGHPGVVAASRHQQQFDQRRCAFQVLRR
jgi:hypothetical protein